jgi:hypothetical protein
MYEKLTRTCFSTIVEQRNNRTKKQKKLISIKSMFDSQIFRIKREIFYCRTIY